MRFANIAAGAGLVGAGVALGEGIRSFPDLGEQAAASEQMLQAGQITPEEHEANLLAIGQEMNTRMDSMGSFE